VSWVGEAWAADRPSARKPIAAGRRYHEAGKEKTQGSAGVGTSAAALAEPASATLRTGKPLALWPRPLTAARIICNATGYVGRQGSAGSRLGLVGKLTGNSAPRVFREPMGELANDGQYLSRR
jgi:hypothetical protein